MNNDTYGYGKCLTTPTLMKYLSVGEETAKQIGRQAGATIIIGKKKVIYNRTKVDEYIDKITGGVLERETRYRDLEEVLKKIYEEVD